MTNLYTPQNYAKASEYINKLVGQRFKDADYKFDIPLLNEYLENKDFEKGKGIILTGAVGVGKTHLMCSIAKIILAYNLTEREKEGVELPHNAKTFSEVIFKRMTTLLYELKRLFGSPKEEDDFILNMQRSAALFIDDLGAEMISDWVKTLFYEIVDDRYARMRPTFITTNLSKQKITEMYGERIVSRLWQSSLVLDVKGENKRLR